MSGRFRSRNGSRPRLTSGALLPKLPKVRCLSARSLPTAFGGNPVASPPHDVFLEPCRNWWKLGHAEDHCFHHRPCPGGHRTGADPVRHAERQQEHRAGASAWQDAPAEHSTCGREALRERGGTEAGTSRAPCCPATPTSEWRPSGALSTRSPRASEPPTRSGTRMPNGSRLRRYRTSRCCSSCFGE
jgi:hypothetical protein